MIRLIQSMAFPRMLTLIASLIGLALIVVVFGMASTGGSPRPLLVYALLAVPFASGLVIAITPMERRTRILLLWLIALGAGLVAALTIFSGIGFFLLAMVAAYLCAAWLENETGR